MKQIIRVLSITKLDEHVAGGFILLQVRVIQFSVYSHFLETSNFDLLYNKECLVFAGLKEIFFNKILAYR